MSLTLTGNECSFYIPLTTASLSKLASLVYLDGHWLLSPPLALHALSPHNATRVQQPSVKRLPGAMGSVTFRKTTLFIPTVLHGLGPVPSLAAFQHPEQRRPFAPQALDWNLVFPRDFLLPYKNPVLGVNLPPWNLVSTAPWDTIFISNIQDGSEPTVNMVQVLIPGEEMNGHNEEKRAVA